VAIVLDLAEANVVSRNSYAERGEICARFPHRPLMAHSFGTGTDEELQRSFTDGLANGQNRPIKRPS
jgi:hypothetical protein